MPRPEKQKKKELEIWMRSGLGAVGSSKNMQQVKDRVALGLEMYIFLREHGFPHEEAAIELIEILPENPCPQNKKDV